MKRGFYFKTKNDNLYYYDDILGYVSYCEHKNKSEENDIIFSEINSADPIECKIEELKNHIVNYGLKQLILLVTQDCNLRCKYCLYSGNYDNNRLHDKQYMTFETAKKAIDNYLLHYYQVKANNPTQIPTIGFYGGEPLLNYDVVKKSFEYVKNTYEFQVNFGITTNATVMTDEMIHFMIDNKFNLSISLNGDKDENDRLRIFKHGAGTYDTIISNLKKIKNINQEYFEKNCSILITYDYGTDLLKLREFIMDNIGDIPKIARITPVSRFFTDWYDQFSDERLEKYKESYKMLKDIFMEKISNNEKPDEFLRFLFSHDVFSVINRTTGIEISKLHPSFIPYTGACVPGSKIAVDSSGLLHCCEKVNSSRPIGDVINWIDYDKVKSLIEDYNMKFMSRCMNCPIQRMCPSCYTAALTGNGEFSTENLGDCSKMIEGLKGTFEDTYFLLENGAEKEIFI